MTPEEARFVLNVNAENDNAENDASAIDAAYETLRSDLRRRLQEAPSPRLRLRLERRRDEVDAAYQALTGSEAESATASSLSGASTSGANHSYRQQHRRRFARAAAGVIGCLLFPIGVILSPGLTVPMGILALVGAGSVLLGGVGGAAWRVYPRLHAADSLVRRGMVLGGAVLTVAGALAVVTWAVWAVHYATTEPVGGLMAPTRLWTDYVAAFVLALVGWLGAGLVGWGATLLVTCVLFRSRFGLD